MGRRRSAASSTTRKVAKAANFRSGFEQKVAKSITTYGATYTYEKDKIQYIIPASKHNYLPDFKLENGIYIEAKGKWDASSRKKMVLAIEQNPDKDIRMLFMRDNTISKNSKTKYSDFCDKRGIKYHVSATGEVPEAWLLPLKKRKKN